MIEPAGAHPDDFVETHRLGKILGVVEREFLSVEIADRRMRFHDDPRFIAVDASHECALNRRDETVLQLMSIFTKVPDIPFPVLSEPIEGILRYRAVRKDTVVNFDTGH